MQLKVLLTSILSFYFLNINAQFSNPSSGTTYVVRWAAGVQQVDKDNYEIASDSRIICDMVFGNREYAWLEFNDPNIDINGGVIGAQLDPEIDGATFDYLSDHTSTLESLNSSCIREFDLTIPFGENPVKLYNLDTGVRLPIDDSSNIPLGLDYSGQVICLQDYPPIQPVCGDENGHGTHGAGIQLSLFNKSLADHGGSNPVNLISYRVFDDNGIGSLGAILCALSDIVADTCHRKIVNCSFSFIRDISNPSPIFDPLEDAFKAMAAESNIFSVCAAGNEGNEITPSFMPFPLGYFSDGLQSLAISSSTIGVGGANCDNTPGAYSNYSHREVDISTLGTMPGPDLSTGIDYYQGTSQATFASSAVAAMLMSHQANVDLITLKCSMIKGSVYNSLFEDFNFATGILSATTSLLLLESGCDNEEPCQTINVVTGIIDDGLYESAGTLHSNGTMYSNDVIFTAETSISLLPGFNADPNMQFHAYIDLCGN